MNTYDSKTQAITRSIRSILTAAGLAVALASPTWAADPVDAAANDGATLTADTDSSADAAFDPESAQYRQWQETMKNIDTPDEGCFHASYPNFFWEKTECEYAPPEAIHTAPVQPEGIEGGVTGSGHDYVAQAKGLITFASGSFVTKGVTSEKSVGVAEYGGGGILGPNRYSLQVNTNSESTTSACAKHPGCTVWQQFLYSVDYIKKGTAAVYIEYWLLNWGSSTCPSGYFRQLGTTNCVKNSPLESAPDFPVTDLGKLNFTGITRAGGLDQVLLIYGKDVYAMTAKDSVLDISSVWHEAEFNVVGDNDGSRADFNKGSDVKVTLVLLDGSTSAPTCVANAGTTGETNNLNLGSCKASGWIPNVVFSESN